ncbi:hypothetical protein BDR07DRAFT_1412019 [Suillus spraguei]|nr:hypothetical protein BDR07DRAFT_1412019 [Suillus spraguei]
MRAPLLCCYLALWTLSCSVRGHLLRLFCGTMQAQPAQRMQRYNQVRRLIRQSDLNATDDRSELCLGLDTGKPASALRRREYTSVMR